MASLASVEALTKGKFSLSISHDAHGYSVATILQYQGVRTGNSNLSAILPIFPAQHCSLHLEIELPYDFKNADYMRCDIHVDRKVIKEHFIDKPTASKSKSIEHCILDHWLLKSQNQSDRMYSL